MPAFMLNFVATAIRFWGGGRWKCGSGKCRGGKSRSKPKGWSMQQ